MASILNATTSSGLVTSADNSGSLQLATNNGTTAVTIDTSQNVGIGTSSPAEKLTVAGNVRTNASSGSNFFQFGTDTTGGYLYSNQATPFLFYTNGAERMRIDSSGRLLVNCTNEPNASINGFKTDVAYTIMASSGQTVLYVNRNTSTGEIQQLRYNNGAVGNISTNGSNCTFNSTSDYRLKENVAPMTGALAKIQLLKPVTYTWKKDGQDGEGFIAHELQEVCPEAVTGTKDAVDEEGKPVYQAIDQSVLVATLTAAIQELKAQLDESNLILTSVKTELDATKAEVQALKGVE